MSDTDDKKPLSLGGKLSLKAPVGAGGAQVKQSFSGGRTKSVTVEVKRRRDGPRPAGQAGNAPVDSLSRGTASVAPTTHITPSTEAKNPTGDVQVNLSEREMENRAAVLARAQQNQGDRRPARPMGVGRPQVVERPKYEDSAPRRETPPQREGGQPSSSAPQGDRRPQREGGAPHHTGGGERRPSMRSTLPARSANIGRIVTPPPPPPADLTPGTQVRPDHRSHHTRKEHEDQNTGAAQKKRNATPAAPTRTARDLGAVENKFASRMTVTQALNRDYDKATTGPSLSSIRRQRQRVKQVVDDGVKQTREVILPEVITVQDLANRMAERSGNVIKALMKMGVMATLNQSIDADTAELLIIDFGHKVKRVTEADIEMGIEGEDDTDTNLQPRAPVVTVMGHVDHGKTSLLDALRKTDVVSGEAGGITQHIGAYQVTTPQGAKITFLDTPGHAAFTEMRARGANVTDIVVLVVAANDSIMPQTIEAIRHAKAANVPMVIACNKIDLPDANPQQVKIDLLQHEVIVEDMGGDVQFVEVSAKKGLHLDKLEDAIMVQAEILELKANPARKAVGRVVESKMETGRGSVATILVQKGTLKIGDIFVCGAEWGRVRALIDDHGKQIKSAGPTLPVEVLGLQGTPGAGDEFVVVEDESKARKISEYRSRKRREKLTTLAPTSAESFFAQVKEGAKKELALVVKGDVHGSLEAIVSSVQKLAGEQDEINVRILLSGVGPITESDVTLAKASNATILGFNVRANAQARQLAEQDGVNVKYYNIIYQILDDLKGLISGMFAPILREEFIGYAQIRQVFNITKVGKIGGCMVTQGFVKRGAKVRLLRDDVVIHEGTLKTLKRFKDEVKEVKEGMECGMAFENYEDIREGDMIECFDVITETRTMA